MKTSLNVAGVLAVLALVGAATVPAFAQQPATPPMTGMSMTGMSTGAPGGDASPSSKAFKAADDKMMHGMTAPMTGDPDQDFVAGMLPHHQGAVDMAKVELLYGKDPVLRRLAQEIIVSQHRKSP